MDAFLKSRTSDPKFALAAPRAEARSWYFQDGAQQTTLIRTRPLASMKEAEKKDSGSDSEGGKKKKKKKVPFAKGSDADGDGKKNETKKVTDFSSKDGDDVPDAFQKKKKGKGKKGDSSDSE